MRVVIAGIALACGCGSVSESKMDAGMDGTVVDAPPDARGPRCDPSKPFGNSMPVANINSPANEFSARLSRDELTIYFSSNRGGGAGEGDIYMATRASVEADFGTPTRLMSLASTGNDGDPMPTPDGLGLIFVRSPAGNTGMTDVYIATRSSPTSDFGQVMPLPGVNTTSEETNTYLTEGGNVLYLTTTRPGGSGSYDIWRATKQSNGSFGQVEPVTQANTTAIDAWPVASEDGKTLLFASNRTGGEIWRLTRPTAGGSFGTPEHVAELETADGEGPEWLSADGCVLYYHHNGPGGLGGSDTWVAKKPL